MGYTSQECEHSIATSVVKSSKAVWETTLRQTLGHHYEVLVGHTLQVRRGGRDVGVALPGEQIRPMHFPVSCCRPRT